MAQHPRRLSTLLLCVAACTSLPTALAFAPTIVSSKSPTLVRRQETSNSQLGVSVEPLQEAWASYNVALEQSPLLVKSLSAGVILGAADLAGQAIESVRNANDETSSSSEEESGGIDVARFVRFAVFGLVLQAPWNHFYYTLLDGAIPPTVEPFTSTNLEKVVIDQFVQAPIFTVLIFVFLGLLEGKQMESIQKQLENDYQDTIVANWKLWVPATVVNIGFVPPILRVLFLNCVFFFWSIYLSLLFNKKEEA
mmetsp:Transcript_13871/g.28644  ORF Transcript_13871/g.28644 Transcript_13871/m.28644 type:complete len:252 (-) Transcript_13871:134-889(-)